PSRSHSGQRAFPFVTHLAILFRRSHLPRQRLERLRIHQPRQRPYRRAPYERRSIAQKPFAGRYELYPARVAGGDQHIADETVAADTLDWRTGKEGAEGRIVELQQVRKGRRLQVLPCLEFRLGSLPGEFVPRADCQAIVAAIDAVAHLPAQFKRYRPDRKSTRLNSSHVKISYA